MFRGISLFVLCASLAHAQWRVSRRVVGDAEQILSVEPFDAIPGPLRDFPELLSEDTPPSREFYREDVYGELPSDCARWLQNHYLTHQQGRWPGSHVETILESGPSENRINLVWAGDGYTEAERDKYFADVRRLASGLLESKAFAPYAPLFNIYAVFVPSKISGIGDGRRANTALGLYRVPKGSKRGILPGNRGAIERALRLAPVRADYPILLANDDFYGGLGGRYAITTRSEETGLMVLKHEVLHNFNQSGEEYDGGQVYTGPNHSSSGTRPPWQEWLEPGATPQEMRFLNGFYAWHDLRRPYRASFNFPDDNRAHDLYIRLSAVGWESLEDVFLFMDGGRIFFNGNPSRDRSFFSLRIKDFKPGRHTLEVQQVRSGEKTLAFAQVYAIPRGYNPEGIQTYRTFYEPGRPAGYRPTHDSCLMRDMEVDAICAPERQSLWHRFLRKVQLIDEVEVREDVAELKVPNVEHLKIRWFLHDGRSWVQMTSLDGKRVVSREELGRGRRKVEVRLDTPDVRNADGKFIDAEEFEVSGLADQGAA